MRVSRRRLEDRILPRYIDIRLEHRGVACVALLLDEVAPTTCDLVWSSLPVAGALWHAKYASNEVYCLLSPMDGIAPGNENTTIIPIPEMSPTSLFLLRSWLRGSLRRRALRDHLQ